MDAPWIVTDQRETIALNPNTGGYVQMIEVKFRTAGNVVASVNVPADTYNVDTVKAAIDAKVAHLDAVAGLNRGDA